MEIRARGRPRRRPWSALPQGEVLTLTEAAHLLCIERSSLRSHLHRPYKPLPACIEVIRDNHKIVGVRRNGEPKSL